MYLNQPQAFSAHPLNLHGMHSCYCEQANPWITDSGCSTDYQRPSTTDCATGYASTVVAINGVCPGQQNRSSSNFALYQGFSSGNYKITVIPDAREKSSNIPYISFLIYHDVGSGTDQPMGNGQLYANGYSVNLQAGNYNYYIGHVSGATYPIKLCFNPA